MITNLIRKALAPSIETLLNEERTRLQIIISAMEDAVDDVKSIRASDIADNINTYDIAQDISVDASDIEVDTRDLVDRICEQIGGNISIDEENIQIDYSALGRHIVGNLDIDASDIEIDYSSLANEIASHIEVDASEINLRDLAGHIAREIGGNIDINYSDLGITISDNIDIIQMHARINNVHTNLQTLERKMDLILKYHGITPENA